MAAGDVADRIGHGQHRQAEGEGDTEEAKAEGIAGVVIGEGRGEHGTAAASEHEPKSAKKFREKLIGEGNACCHLRTQEDELIVPKTRGGIFFFVAQPTL